MGKIGSVGWVDLTIDNAEALSGFYEKVIGLKPEAVNMGDYSDFNMNSPVDGSTQVGICHARGANADIPPVWMVYFFVSNIHQSVENLKEEGGEALSEIKEMGKDQYVFIKDPAGAVCALYQKG